MDPNQNLAQQLELAKRILANVEDGEAGKCDFIIEAKQLADTVLAMNNWLRKGGFLPKAWGKKR